MFFFRSSSALLAGTTEDSCCRTCVGFSLARRYRRCGSTHRRPGLFGGRRCVVRPVGRRQAPARTTTRLLPPLSSSLLPASAQQQLAVHTHRAITIVFSYNKNVRQCKSRTPFFQNVKKWKPYCSIFFFRFSPGLFLKFTKNDHLN